MRPPRVAWARAPAAPVALAFAGGIALAARVPAAVAWAVWALALVLAVVALARARLVAASLLVLAAVVALGVLRPGVERLRADAVGRLALPLAARVEGRIAADPVRFAPDRARLLLDVARVDGAPRSGLVQLGVYGEGLPALAEGQRVAVQARLAAPGGFRNPGGFDHAARLRRDGIRVVGSARADRVTPLDEPRPPWPARVRRAVRATLDRELPPASAALLAGLLLGDRAGLPAEIDDAFRRAGVYHVLAVSGFNVALVGGSAFALFCALARGRRVAAAAAIAVVVAFALIAGPAPSVLRALVMAVLVLAALLLEREPSVLNGLALAALAVLAARPGDLADPGFQLSFAATAGIVLAPIPRGRVTAALAVSLAATVAVLPVSLAHFNQLSLVGPLANLAAVPLAGLATVLGLLAVGIDAVSASTGAALLGATWPLLLALRGAAALAAAVPAAVVHLPAPPATAIAAYVAALALALAWWHGGGEGRRPRWPAAGAAALLAVAVLLEAWPLVRPPDGRLHVTVLDVGQGDAIVIEAPDGRVALVDAGPGGGRRLDAGARAVAPFLWNRGVRRLALVVATHEDQDHAGGLAALRRLFPVDETWRAGTAPGWRPFGGATLAVLPAPSPSLGGNDDGVVLRAEHGLASFLLTADVGVARERAWLAAGVPLAATVLKVAHHGARGATSPAFLRAVAPAVAVVSVGARNPYRHPAAETLAQLDAVGARTYRTDRDGAVLMATDGRVLDVGGWARATTERYCLDPNGVC
jgi:competence protein ComEC